MKYICWFVSGKKDRINREREQVEGHDRDRQIDRNRKRNIKKEGWEGEIEREEEEEENKGAAWEEEECEEDDEEWET